MLKTLSNGQLIVQDLQALRNLDDPLECIIFMFDAVKKRCRWGQLKKSNTLGGWGVSLCVGVSQKYFSQNDGVNNEIL